MIKISQLMDSLSASTILVFTFHQLIIFAYYNSLKITKNFNIIHTDITSFQLQMIPSMDYLESHKKLCLQTLEVIQSV